jgi:hypothetical protein
LEDWQVKFSLTVATVFIFNLHSEIARFLQDALVCHLVGIGQAFLHNVDKVFAKLSLGAIIDNLNGVREALRVSVVSA